jgi:CMP-N,N'-diacetyllegionaminic acid synthase
MRRPRAEVIALIPARSGSRRVPNKNIRKLGGKPLIAYTIEAALQSRLVDRVVVSTDSERIAEIARRYGAEIPFLRPSLIASANSTEFEFHKHALDHFTDIEGRDPELIVNLYPTSPFRQARTIDEAIRAIKNNKLAHSLRSMRLCAEHPYKMWTFATGRLVRPFVDKKGRTQTLSYHLLPKVYIQNASIYIVRPSTLRRFRNTVGTRVLGFLMSEEESIDINSPLDLFMANTYLKSARRV